MSALPSGMIVQAPALSALDFIDSLANDSIRQWRSSESGVAAAVETLESALQVLGDRKGPREDAARAFLSAERERLAVPLGAFKAWQQTRADLVERLASAQHSARLAQLAHASAEPAEATVARDLLEVEQAKLRAVGRDINAAISAVGCPMPQRGLDEIVEQAKAETLALAGIHKKYPARLAHDALDQGLRAARAGSSGQAAAGRTRAALWVCFEAPGKNPKLAEAFALRHARFEEA